MFEIQTERLRLRPLRRTDVTNLMKIFGDPVAMNYYPGTKSEDEAVEWIDWNIANYDAFNVGLWAVELKQDGTFIGQCGIVPQKVNGEMMMEIGYLFIRDYWGHGFATEAASACLNYGLHTCRYPKMISLITPDNLPSIAVATRIGMKKNEHIEKWGKRIDVYSTSLHEMEKSS
ncbi:GNAT family N-acetyltransferase [Pseudalkalibacillus sp. SCS-8]|uniref:GNAT family N-acetyltransferase n=1 Tax=Pseudalkalibacillus nanhaiensis TaxID=3115291 RepID=UPI0032DA4175